MPVIQELFSDKIILHTQHIDVIFLKKMHKKSFLASDFLI